MRGSLFRIPCDDEGRVHVLLFDAKRVATGEENQRRDRGDANLDQDAFSEGYFGVVSAYFVECRKVDLKLEAWSRRLVKKTM